MVTFNEKDHTYNGGKLIPVTQVLREMGIAPDYSSVPQDLLQNKAEKGKLIHKEIEEWNKTKEQGFTKELNEYISFINNGKYSVLESEKIVNDEDIAGTLDIVLGSGKKSVIVEIKTTSVVYKEVVSWQLSIYAYLYGKIDKGLCLHFLNDGSLETIDIPLKTTKQVEKLLEDYKNGYRKCLIKLDGVEKELVELRQIQQIIATIDNNKKLAEQRANVLKEEIIKAMKSNNITKYSDDTLTLSYIAPSKRESLDTTRLKAEQPDLVKLYTRETEVKESLRITFAKNCKDKE